MLSPFDNVSIDKHYLRDLVARELKVPTTQYIEGGERISLREVFCACGWTEAVLKPVVSGAARHTYRVNLASIDEHESILFDLLQRLVLARRCDIVYILRFGHIITFRLNVVRRVCRALQLPGGKLQRRNV